MSDIKQMLEGKMPIRRTNPKAGESEWYYLDTHKQPTSYTLLSEDLNQIDVPSANTPNPLYSRKPYYPETTAGIVSDSYDYASTSNPMVGNVTQPMTPAYYDNRPRTTTQPISFNENANLSFDGRTLTLNENGQPVKSWPAQSGNAEHQRAGSTNYEGLGPLPQGNWVVDQSRVQHIDDLSLFDRAKNYAGKIIPGIGKWRGDVPAWGHHRVWLSPDEGTNTHGRSGFTIHGGWDYGSAGCIDLADQDTDFFNTIKDKGNLRLNVHYPNDSWEPRSK